MDVVSGGGARGAMLAYSLVLVTICAIIMSTFGQDGSQHELLHERESTLDKSEVLHTIGIGRDNEHDGVDTGDMNESALKEDDEGLSSPRFKDSSDDHLGRHTQVEENSFNVPPPRTSEGVVTSERETVEENVDSSASSIDTELDPLGALGEESVVNGGGSSFIQDITVLDTEPTSNERKSSVEDLVEEISEMGEILFPGKTMGKMNQASGGQKLAREVTESNSGNVVPLQKENLSKIAQNIKVHGGHADETQEGARIQEPYGAQGDEKINAEASGSASESTTRLSLERVPIQTNEGYHGNIREQIELYVESPHEDSDVEVMPLPRESSRQGAAPAAGGELPARPGEAGKISTGAEFTTESEKHTEASNHGRGEQESSPLEVPSEGPTRSQAASSDTLRHVAPPARREQSDGGEKAARSETYLEESLGSAVAAARSDGGEEGAGKAEEEEDPELIALREITEIQEEETRAVEQEEEDKLRDAEMLHSLDEVAEQQTKRGLEEDQAHFSQRPPGESSSRQALNLGDLDDTHEEARIGTSDGEATRGTATKQSSSFFGKKRVGSVRGSPPTSGPRHDEGTEALPMRSGAGEMRAKGMQSAPDLFQQLEERLGGIQGDAQGAFGSGVPGGSTVTADSGADSLRAYKLPRAVARPVERTLAIYEDYKTSLYDVLGLPKDCDDVDVKQAYRALALILHPDKNPHPKAKVAFDAIQDAFKTLSTPLARNEYDKEFRRRSRLTYRRLRKRVLAFFHNQYSILQVISHRVLNGEAPEIALEWKQILEQKAADAKGLRVHFQLLPSLADRFMLLHELIADNRVYIGQVVAIIAIL